MVRRVVMIALLSFGVTTARAQAGVEGPAVEAVVTATGDARDLLTLDGATYVATDGGLVVVRGGRRARVIGARDGLTGARLRSVSWIDGELWVGGVEGGARLRADEAGELRVEERIPVRRIRRAARFGGAVYLASYGGGLFRYADGVAQPVSLGSAHAYRRVTDILVRGEELWVATHGAGVLRIDREHTIRGRFRRAQGLRSPYVWRLAAHGEVVAVLTIDGLSVIVDNAVVRRHRWTRAASRLPVRDLRAVAWSTGPDETMWLGTFGRGLFRVDPGHTRPRPVGRVEEVHALVGDGEGVWVAHSRGVGRGHGRRLTALLRGGLPSGDITALARAHGALWVGTFGHGLARERDGTFESVTTERWSVDGRINDLAVTGRGERQRLWIATDRGLWWHDGRVYSRVEDPAGPSWVHTTSLHVDGAGALWVTTSRELCRRRRGGWRCWTGDPTFPVANLHSVTTDRRGQVWVGGLHGLYRFNPRGGRFRRHTVSSRELPADWVTSVAPWGRGIVAGTYHGGLAITTGDGFRIIREGEGGLASGWVNPHAIRNVDGSLWMGTLERGLLVGRPGAWRHLTTREGLPSDDVTAVLPDREGVWVATRGGLARLSR